VATRSAKRLLALALTGAALACAAGRSDAPPSLHDQVEEMLAHAAQHWNRGDLDAFVEDYLDSARTTFIGSRGVLHGRAAIRNAYAPRFEAGGVRDSLSFEGLEVDSLAPGVAHVLAFYVLSRGDSTVARGPTSLVLVRQDGRWRIVHDHSS
jgi:uncharacterized protein (TIGR02246 family)